MSGKYGNKSLWSWFLYDWAAQPYNTLLLTFIFGPYFTSTVVGDSVAGQAQWGFMTGTVGLSLAFLAPVLGAFADSTGPRKPWVFGFSMMYFVGSFALWWAVPNMPSTLWILIIFGIGFLGMELGQVFINAIMPDVSNEDDVGLISGLGFAFGYFGGVIALIVMLLFLAENDSGKTLLGNAPLFGLDPITREGTRSVGPLSAIWYLIFVIPFFLWVPDRKRKDRVQGAVGKSLREIKDMIATLPENVSLAAFLGSSMFYRDALNGMYFFGGIYAAGVLGWDIVSIGIFGIIAATAAGIFCIFGGFADRAFGPKPVIVWCVIALLLVCITVVGLSRESFMGMPLAEGSTLPDRVFMFCGATIGAAGGILQAASRTMVVYQADEDDLTKAFGLYALAGRATAFLAPFAIGIVTTISGSQRIGISPVIILFLIGLCLLFWVKPVRSK
jgi:UMF1 family MFS transporter